MTRHTDRLEILARDLASRYGENDQLVRAMCPRSADKRVPAVHIYSAWRPFQRQTFWPARLARLGIGSLP